MHLIFFKDERDRQSAQLAVHPEDSDRPLSQTIFHFVALVGILLFATWAKPAEATGLWYSIYSIKWWLTGGFGVLLGFSLVFIFKLNWKWVAGIAAMVAVAAVISPYPEIPFLIGVLGTSLLLIRSGGEAEEWFDATWEFTKQILPLLAIGVLVAGFLLGSPDGGQGLIPQTWIASLVGGNSLFANFFASIVGAFMYFATLTEIPILQGLVTNGMGNGPALALLLAGPALSLPNMLVIRSVMGTRKTLVFVGLVVVMSTASGMLFGLFF